MNRPDCPGKPAVEVWAGCRRSAAESSCSWRRPLGVDGVTSGNRPARRAASPRCCPRRRRAAPSAQPGRRRCRKPASSSARPGRVPGGRVDAEHVHLAERRRSGTFVQWKPTSCAGALGQQEAGRVEPGLRLPGGQIGCGPAALLGVVGERGGVHRAARPLVLADYEGAHASRRRGSGASRRRASLERAPQLVAACGRRRSPRSASTLAQRAAPGRATTRGPRAGQRATAPRAARPSASRRPAISTACPSACA